MRHELTGNFSKSAAGQSDPQINTDGGKETQDVNLDFSSRISAVCAVSSLRQEEEAVVRPTKL